MIATVTYHKHDNYGAVLQCYALQQTILGMGQETEVLNYACHYVQNPFSIEAMKKKGFVGYLLGIFGWMSRLPRRKKFASFRKKYLSIGLPVTAKDLSKIEEKYDLFVVGSDNVWNPEITNFDPTYYLNFISDSRKKTSYAASFGLGEIPEKWRPYCQKWLSSFSRIGMREKEGAQAVQELLNREASVVLDPTMLLSGQEWADRFKLAQKTPKEKYLLVYQMVPSARLLELAEEAAQQLQCKIKCVPFPFGKIIRCRSCLRMGPVEWLESIYHADFIITDSFHGTVFSILFHKKFAVCISQLGNRIRNILENLGLELVLCNEKDKLDTNPPINYKTVEEKLAFLREKSQEYLCGLWSDKGD